MAKPTEDTLEPRVIALAEHVGRFVGTVQARAEGWMDTDALKEQIASMRDGAADLLERLGTGATTKPAKRSSRKGKAAAKTTRRRGRR